MKKLTYEKLGEIFDYTFKTGESYTEEIRQRQNADWLAALEEAGWTDDEWLDELERRMDENKKEI